MSGRVRLATFRRSAAALLDCANGALKINHFSVGRRNRPYKRSSSLTSSHTRNVPPAVTGPEGRHAVKGSELLLLEGLRLHVLHAEDHPVVGDHDSHDESHDAERRDERPRPYYRHSVEHLHTHRDHEHRYRPEEELRRRVPQLIDSRVHVVLFARLEP